MLCRNGGYIILGTLIERLTGVTYYDYVSAHITGPAGMSDTRHYPMMTHALAALDVK